MSEVKEITEDIVKIAEFAKAMSHPVRVYILKKLTGLNACCYSGDIAQELQIGRSAISQHLKELKQAGLIQGHFNRPFIKYCINTENWAIAKKMFSELFDK